MRESREGGGGAPAGRGAVARGLAVGAAAWIAALSSGPARAEDSAHAGPFCFPVGERLSYHLYWGVIPVGTAELLTEWTEDDGRRVLAIRAVARTTAVVAKLYPVEDHIESLVDPESFLPIRYTQRLREGRHRRDDTVRFDHARGVARWTSDRTGEEREIAIDQDTRDVLCLTYFMRGQGMEVGRKEAFRVFVDDKVYDLEMTGLKQETLGVRGVGEVACLKVEPRARFGAIFVRKGKVMAWFSLDARRLCVRMTGKVPLASVKAVLVGVSGPGDDPWVRLQP